MSGPYVEVQVLYDEPFVQGTMHMTDSQLKQIIATVDSIEKTKIEDKEKLHRLQQSVFVQ